MRTVPACDASSEDSRRACSSESAVRRCRTRSIAGKRSRSGRAGEDGVGSFGRGRLGIVAHPSIAAAFCLALACRYHADPSHKETPGMFVHFVLFWMKPGTPDSARAQLVEDSLAYLGKVPTVRNIWAGRPAMTPREVVDN